VRLYGRFDLTCEGLARWNGCLAWHIRSYKVNGITYPVSLKGALGLKQNLQIQIK